MLAAISEKVKQGERITRQDAEYLYKEASDSALMELSSAVRARFHKENQATYLIMAIVNYTNICVAKCDYCSFYRLPHQSGTYLLSFEQIAEKIDAVQELGGTFVGFNGGFHPKLHLSHYAEVFRKTRERYGENVEFYGMTVAEFMFACRVSKMSYEEGIELLKANGVRWIPGGGAEVLDEAFRKRHSPGKYTVAKFYEAQRAIVKGGLGSTATMVIGFDETLEERMNHLDSLRNFQDDTKGGLASFLCWTYKPYNNELGGEEVSTQEYLRWLAISRIYLDNFKHIRTSVLTQNEGALDGLKYGADDFDLPVEDEVTQKAGATISHEFKRILDHAKELGFEAKMRESLPVSASLEIIAFLFV